MKFKPEKIILHCSASPNAVRCDISEIRKWHLARGFTDVGYHLVLQPDGEVQNGRSLTSEGAHCSGENDNSFGVCLVGNDRFSMKQFDALRYKLDSLVLCYDIPKWAIYGHYQFKSAIKQGKTCPNIDMQRLLFWYLTGNQDALKPYL